MADFYKKNIEKFYYHQGEKYIHTSAYKNRVNTLLDTAQSCQKRYIDAEKILLLILNSKFLSLIFGKTIRKAIKAHIEKYKNHELKF